jgi:hypothetical protein
MVQIVVQLKPEGASIAKLRQYGRLEMKGLLHIMRSSSKQRCTSCIMSYSIYVYCVDALRLPNGR